MHLFRAQRFILLVLLALIGTASLQAQLNISIRVGFAPPMLPVYLQPMCPQPNLMWTPGYWAYSNDDGDYYWVPGAWVPAPYEGALWTPPYWEWDGGRYGFHDGYWSRHVGYYGGVNYGFGFGGVGFAGGEWRGNSFAYNTAVMRVNQRYVHSTYVDRRIVQSGIVASPRHVAYSGGPGGIQHAPQASERAVEQESHVAPTALQAQHAVSARTDKSSFAKENSGRPAHVVVARPLGADKSLPSAQIKGQTSPVVRTTPSSEVQPRATSNIHATPAPAQHASQPAQHAAPAQRPAQHAAPAQRSTPPVQRAAPAQQHSSQPAQHASPAQKNAPNELPKQEKQ